MSYEIAKGSSKFLYGISDPSQIKAWLLDNPHIIGYAFVGRSNVGKSSLINSLFGKQTARVSKTPGRTKEINIFSFELNNQGRPEQNLPPLYLFDLPGYGFAEVAQAISRNWNLLMGAFFENAGDMVDLINLQDARHPSQKADLNFRDFIKSSRFNTTLVFNKMDKLKKQKERAALNKLRPTFFKEYKNAKQMFFISAESKQGLRELENSLIADILQKSELISISQ